MRGEKRTAKCGNESLTRPVPVCISSIIFYLHYILWCSIWLRLCYSSLLNVPCSFLSLNINFSHIGNVFPCAYLPPEFLNWMHYCQWGSYLEVFLILTTWLWALLTYNEEFRDAKCLVIHGSILPNEELSQIPNGKNWNANNNDGYNAHQTQSSQYCVVMISTSDTQFLIPAMSLTSYILWVI